MKEATLYSALRAFLAQVFQRHKRVTKRHARRSVAHNGFNVLLGLPLLALRLAILTVSRMPIWACLRTLQCGVYCRATPRTQSRAVLFVLRRAMMRIAVNTPNGLQRCPIFFFSGLLHACILMNCAISQRILTPEQPISAINPTIPTSVRWDSRFCPFQFLLKQDRYSA